MAEAPCGNNPTGAGQAIFPRRQGKGSRHLFPVIRGLTLRPCQRHLPGRIGKIKPLFMQSHPPASAHPLPPCARWCPRLGSAHPPHTARLAQALPGRARRRPHPRRAGPVGSRQATGPRRRARPGRRPGSQRGWKKMSV
jgi:hypothetical protein